MRSSVTTKGSHQQQSSSAGHHSTTPASQGHNNKGNKKVSGSGTTKSKDDLEKKEVKEKSYNWIARRMNWLDPEGYDEEIYSFQHFGQNSESFTLEIIAIADWGWRNMDLGFNYPVPTFPNYLFNEFSGSCQYVGQVPMKPESLYQSGSDIWGRYTEAWTLMVTTLQFWTDEELIANKPVHSASAPTPEAHWTPSGEGCGQVIKLHLKRATQGPGWIHIEPKDAGLDVTNHTRHHCNPSHAGAKAMMIWPFFLRNMTKHTKLAGQPWLMSFFLQVKMWWICSTMRMICSKTLRSLRQ